VAFLSHLVVCALAANAPEVWIQPGDARPGDAVLVRVFGSAEAPDGELGEKALDFARFGDGWVALSGLSVDQELGPLPFAVRFGTREGEVELSGALEVKDPKFPARELSVSKKFTSPDRKAKKRMRDDQRAFNRAFAQEFEPPRFSGNFEQPRVAVTTAPFGDLRLFNGKKKSQHYGQDLDGNTGDPSYSTNDGVVVMARDCFGSGNTVLVHHGLQLYSAYFHLSKIEVKVGQKVKRGQLLGLVGKTGRVTGPHLHFGTKIDGRWVDPQSVLRLNFASPPGPRTEAGLQASARPEPK
jgi:murein DD-endopeptidase MepM/ murein hydrolase activator NlpD